MSRDPHNKKSIRLCWYIRFAYYCFIRYLSQTWFQLGRFYYCANTMDQCNNYFRYRQNILPALDV